MKTEISAGGIVYKIENGKPLILLLKDQNGQWTFPKGLIEDDEDKVKTAKREIAEEVGLKKVALVSPLSPIEYWYKWEGELIKKTVYYYLFKTQGKEQLKPQGDEGISEVKWFTPQEALKIIGYRKTNAKLLKEAIAKMTSSTDKGPWFPSFL